MKKFFLLTKYFSFLLALCAVFALMACKHDQKPETPDPTPNPGPNPGPNPTPDPSNKEYLSYETQGIPFTMVRIPDCKAQRISSKFQGGYGLTYVTLSPFYMMETEVTQELYYSVMGENPSKFTESDIEEGEEQMKRPVECVSWTDAVIFCNKLTEDVMGAEECVYDIGGGPAEKGSIKMIVNDEGKIERKGFRLPSSTEWEWACRGGHYQPIQYIGPILPETEFEGLDELEEQARYARINELNKKCWAMLPEYAWVGKEGKNKTHEVKKKKPNLYKLYDMSGNVAEWVWDTFLDDDSLGNYPDYIKKGEPVPEDIVKINPFGPEPQSTDDKITIRGSTTVPPDKNFPAHLLLYHSSCTYRLGSTVNSTANWLGFRIVCGELNGE